MPCDQAIRIQFHALPQLFEANSLRRAGREPRREPTREAGESHR
jgi:hypothetical protein